MEEALEAATAKYLASNAFRVVRADYFWEEFEDFHDLAVKRFPNIDFSFIIPDKGDAEAEEGQEEVGQREGEVVTEGVVEEAVTVDAGEASRKEGSLGEVALGDVNPQE